MTANETCLASWLRSMPHLLLRLQLPLLLLGREVLLDVELGEEYEEEDGVCADVVGELPGEVAVVVEHQLEAVHHDADKLDHLQRGHVLLPPDVAL